MSKKLYLLIAASAFLVAPAIHAETTSTTSKTTIDHTDDGNYTAKSTTQQDEPSGTTITKTDKLKMSTDSKGTTDKKVESDTTRDPPGLFNKTTSKTVDESIKNPDGTGKTVHKQIINGKTVEDNTQETK